ncbi:tetratricopeptide repeat protein, partial [Phytoactinopolyspora endophytica]|uniref:tetratricopeptide repeat protein n=1 Tax=Phytoactinopolyspora endophytica TaxID=1642495 RepID=UPI0013EAA4C2
RLPLDVFSSEEAVTLLRDVAGPELIDTDLASATELVEASGCLPLAVGLTATRIATKPSWALADHLEPLRRRRDSLRLDDAVHATIDLSYAALPPSAQATLRMLAAHPCTDLDTAAVAALTDHGAGHVQDDLDALLTHHLVSRPRPGRYALHALVRTYALDRSYDHDRPTERDAALGRLGTHYVDMVWRAHEVTNATVGNRRRRVPVPADPADIDEDGARAWLESNVENILTLAGHGTELGQPDLAVHLSEGVAWWLNRFGRYREAKLLHRLALDAARSRSDDVGEARADLDLGQILVRLNDWDEASTHLERAETALKETGDLFGASSAVNALAIMSVHLGRISDGIERFHRSLELGRAAENGHAIATTLDNLAVCYRRAGRLDDALTYHRMAFEEAVRINDRYMQASGLVNMSDVQLLLGANDDALQSAQRGLVMGREINNAPTIALASTNLGNIRSASGDHEQAVLHHLEALTVSRDVGDRHVEAG